MVLEVVFTAEALAVPGDSTAVDVRRCIMLAADPGMPVPADPALLRLAVLRLAWEGFMVPRLALAGSAVRWLIVRRRLRAWAGSAVRWLIVRRFRLPALADSMVRSGTVPADSAIRAGITLADIT